MEAVIMEKLKILAESAKFDVSCSSSGSNRQNDGRIGNAHVSGICHSWGSDGRCISLLKILFTNRCEFECEYCVNRRSNDVPRASFEPDELARLTIEFYRRNYIEGLFVSSAVERSPDYTAERMLECIRLLRHKYGFSGYIHAKMIPGASPEMIHMTGLEADRVSVNIEMPDSVSLSRFAPQKKPKAIFAPMRQITNSLIERNALVGPGNMFRGQEINSAEHYLTGRTKNVQKTPQGIYIPEGRGTGRSSYPAGAVQDRQCHSRKMASGAYCGGNSPAEGPGSAVDANCGGNDSAGSRRIADKSGASGSPGYFSGADRYGQIPSEGQATIRAKAQRAGRVMLRSQAGRPMWALQSSAIRLAVFPRSLQSAVRGIASGPAETSAEISSSHLRQAFLKSADGGRTLLRQVRPHR